MRVFRSGKWWWSSVSICVCVAILLKFLTFFQVANVLVDANSDNEGIRGEQVDDHILEAREAEQREKRKRDVGRGKEVGKHWKDVDDNPDVQYGMFRMFCKAYEVGILPYDTQTPIPASFSYLDPASTLPGNTPKWHENLDVESEVLNHLVDFLHVEDVGVRKILYYVLENCPGIMFEVLVRHYVKTTTFYAKPCPYEPTSDISSSTGESLPGDVAVFSPPKSCNYRMSEKRIFGQRMLVTGQHTASNARFLRRKMKYFSRIFRSSAWEKYRDIPVSKDLCGSIKPAIAENVIAVLSDPGVQGGASQTAGLDSKNLAEIAREYTDFLGDDWMSIYAHPDCAQRDYKDEMQHANSAAYLFDNSSQTADTLERMALESPQWFLGNTLASGRDDSSMAFPVVHRTLFYAKLYFDLLKGLERLLQVTGGEMSTFASTKVEEKSDTVAESTCFTFLCGVGSATFTVANCIRRVGLAWGNELFKEDVDELLKKGNDGHNASKQEHPKPDICVLLVADSMPTREEIRENGLSKQILERIDFIIRRSNEGDDHRDPAAQYLAEVHQRAADKGKPYIVILSDLAYPSRRSWDVSLSQAKDMLDWHEDHDESDVSALAISLTDRIITTNAHVNHFPEFVDAISDANGIRNVHGELRKTVGGQTVQLHIEDPMNTHTGAEFSTVYSLVNAIVNDFWLYQDNDVNEKDDKTDKASAAVESLTSSVRKSIAESFKRVVNLASGTVRANGFDNILGGSQIVQRSKQILEWIQAAPWPVFYAPAMEWDILPDVELSVDALFLTTNPTSPARVFSHIGFTEGFVNYVQPFAENSPYEFNPGIGLRIFPDQMVSYKTDSKSEKMIKDAENRYQQSMNLFYDYNHAEDPIVSKAIATTITDTTTTAEDNDINVSVHFEYLDFPFPARELFGNNLMDIVEFLNVFSTQGGNSYIIPPTIVDYEAHSLDHVAFHRERESFKQNRIEKYGQDYWDKHMKPDFDREDPNNRNSDTYRYWVFGGAGDYRTWKTVPLSEFFDKHALERYLTSRGSGGFSLFGNDKNRPRIILNGKPYRKLDVLLLPESITFLSTEYTRTSKEMTLLPCEDSDVPIRFRFFREDYYIMRVRCVGRRDSGINFPKLTRVLKEETQRKYDELIHNKKTHKRWDDLLENSGHNRKTIALLKHAVKTEEFGGDGDPNSYAALAKQHGVPVSYVKRLFDKKTNMSLRDFRRFDFAGGLTGGRESNFAQSSLVMGFYSSLLEGLESEKMHLGRYKTWSPNMNAPTVWSGLALHKEIRGYGLNIRRAMAAKGFSSMDDLHYWSIHWRRGDGNLGPVWKRIRQFDRAEPGNLFRLVKDFLISRYGVSRNGIVSKGITKQNLPMRQAQQKIPKHFFIITNERKPEALAEVRETFKKELAAKVWFLNDFIDGSSGDPNSHRIDGLSEFLNRQMIYPMLVEMDVACHADEFLGYGNGDFEGENSMPSLLVAQLRLWQCKTSPAQGLFSSLIELVKTYDYT